LPRAGHIIIHTDGGSRGNPGPAASAFVLTDDAGKPLQGRGFFLGRATNNVAEYTAVLRALQAARQIEASTLTVFSDSELLVKQINGYYRVKSPKIRPLYRKVMDVLNQFEDWAVEHILREENKQADKLVNQSLDLQKDVEAKLTDSVHLQRPPLRLGVLISGGGRTLMNILAEIRAGRLNAEVAVVISSRSTAAGVAKARNAGLGVEIIRKKDFPDIAEFSRQIEKQLTQAKVELVVQAGWMCLWQIPPRYTNRVMNIHPALLPSFGGKGMWGHHVHRAVLDCGCKISGCTVHFCTNEYDRGPVVIQRCCEVRDGDTVDTLAARVFEQECIAYPQAIRLFHEGRLMVRDGKVKTREF